MHSSIDFSFMIFMKARRREKNGFTLAEVLITLGIIGVVAALTAPQLNSNVAGQKIGPSLSTFSKTFEDAVQKYFVVQEKSSLGYNDIDALSGYMFMTPETGDDKTLSLKDGTVINTTKKCI